MSEALGDILGVLGLDDLFRIGIFGQQFRGGRSRHWTGLRLGRVGCSCTWRLAWRRSLGLIRRRFAGALLGRGSMRLGFRFGFFGSLLFFGLCFFRHKVWWYDRYDR